MTEQERTVEENTHTAEENTQSVEENAQTAEGTAQMAEEIAQWMLEELKSAGKLYQDHAVAHIRENYGEAFVYVNENGNVSIDKEVKKKFKKLHGGRAAWERDGFFWAWI